MPKNFDLLELRDITLAGDLDRDGELEMSVGQASGWVMGWISRDDAIRTIDHWIDVFELGDEFARKKIRKILPGVPVVDLENLMP